MFAWAAVFAYDIITTWRHPHLSQLGGEQRSKLGTPVPPCHTPEMTQEGIEGYVHSLKHVVSRRAIEKSTLPYAVVVLR